MWEGQEWGGYLQAGTVALFGRVLELEPQPARRRMVDPPHQTEHSPESPGMARPHNRGTAPPPAAGSTADLPDRRLPASSETGLRRLLLALGAVQVGLGGWMALTPGLVLRQRGAVWRAQRAPAAGPALLINHGHQVVALTRSPAKLDSLRGRYGSDLDETYGSCAAGNR
jgi:hypothetical protein